MGVLNSSFKNPAGIKTTTGGANNDPSAHQRFVSWEQGITAHIEHLRLYAGVKTDNPIDPRHFPSLHGTAKTVEALGGKWAPSPDYGISIVRDYLEPMIEFARTWKPEPQPESEPEPPETLIIQQPQTPQEFCRAFTEIIKFLQRMVAKFLG